MLVKQYLDQGAISRVSCQIKQDNIETDSLINHTTEGIVSHDEICEQLVILHVQI